MWLINTRTFKLECFLNHLDAPPYAILSHRWRDGELTFAQFQDEEFMKMQGCRMRGWTKIKTFCNRALRHHNLDFAWVDTCCIDKSSSAELSESINSMFDLYRYARICTAYLDDFSLLQDDALFTNSSWFNRGWTLQELIAPLQLEFLDCEWEDIGFKYDLCRQISSRTDIPIPILYRPYEYSIEHCCIAQRMSWAAKRQTSREEDMAYCLLGILNVNMPLIYGEGQSNAFRRLQLEIIKKSNDHSIFAWTKSTYDLIEFDLTRTALLARGVEQFRGCTGVRHSTGVKSSEPYEMTNQGLRITFTIYPLDVIDGVQRFVAPLACTVSGLNLALLLIRSPRKSRVYFVVGRILTPSSLGQGEFLRIIIENDTRILDISPFDRSATYRTYTKTMEAIRAALLSDEYYEEHFRSDLSLLRLWNGTVRDDEYEQTISRLKDTRLKLQELGFSGKLMKRFEEICSFEIDGIEPQHRWT